MLHRMLSNQPDEVQDWRPIWLMRRSTLEGLGRSEASE